jgi:hypothetical protein
MKSVSFAYATIAAYYYPSMKMQSRRSTTT